MQNIPPPELVSYCSETVIYIGVFFHVWGHVITDDIRRLWFLNSEEFKSTFKNVPLVYISYVKINEQKNFKRLLEILGIDVDSLKIITKPTQFDKIILPDESFFANAESSYRRFTNEYRETIDRVRNFALKNRTPTPYKKIYYFHGKRQIGEERLAEYFKSKGYEIISPEKLTLDEQLNLLINCESFASTVGSCAHNSVFLRDGTETIFIPRRNSYTFHQFALDQVHPLSANYVDSSVTLFKKSLKKDALSFCYIISKQLKEFFGDKWNGYEEADFKNFLQYLKNSLNQDIACNQKTQEYYSPVLQDFMEQLKRHKDLIKDYDIISFDWDNFRSQFSYQTHVAARGWNDGWKKENQISNDINQKRDIQAIKINFPGHKVFYSVYYNDKEGWSKEILSPEMAGTTGKSKPIYGIRIRLDETDTKEFDILYRVHKFDDTWTPWVKNGGNLYSHGQRLNAIQIKLEAKTVQSN